MIPRIPGSCLTSAPRSVRFFVVERALCRLTLPLRSAPRPHFGMDTKRSCSAGSATSLHGNGSGDKFKELTPKNLKHTASSSETPPNKWGDYEVRQVGVRDVCKRACAILSWALLTRHPVLGQMNPPPHKSFASVASFVHHWCQHQPPPALIPPPSPSTHLS